MFSLLFILPLIIAIAAVKTNYYPLKALVTTSCIGIILLSARIFGTWQQDHLLIIGAFLFSIGGDFYLSTRGEETGKKSHYFVYGISLFFLAHMGYLCYVCQSANMNMIPLLILIIPFLIYFLIRLLPHLHDNSLKIAVFLYLIISCFSLSLVFGFIGESHVRFCLIGGIGLIVFSDICIAESNFVGLPLLDKLILPTYYAAHILITIGLII